MSDGIVKRRAIPAMAAGVAVVLAMIWLFDPRKILAVITRTDPRLFALAVCVQLVDLLLWALRWHLVLIRVGVKAPLRLVLAVNNVSMLVNNITPSARSGGEPVRVYLLARMTRYRARDIASSVVIDRVLDYFPLTLLLLVSAFLIAGNGGGGGILAILLGGVLFLTVALVLSLWLLASERYVHRVARGVLRLLSRVSSRVCAHRRWEELDEWVERFVKQLRGLLRDRRTLIQGTLVSAAVWGCEIFRTYVVFSSLGREVSLPVIVVSFTVSMFAGVLPLLPGGLGLVEISTASVYRLWGIDPGTSAAVALLDRLISYWMVNAIGVISLLRISRRGG
ncbi:flippase-like domain-containing protein [Methanopyrus sp.]